MLIIFDVDGTLVGGESSERNSFAGAIQAVLDFAPTEDFYTALSDITAQRIAEAAVRACIGGMGSDGRSAFRRSICAVSARRTLRIRMHSQVQHPFVIKRAQ